MAESPQLLSEAGASDVSLNEPAFDVCDVVCEAFGGCATRLATGGARVDELVSPAGGAAGAYV